MHTTVSELIEKLKTFSPDTLVLVDGYEDGYADIGAITPSKVTLNVHKEEYYGPHDEIDGSNMSAIIIKRAPNPNNP